MPILKIHRPNNFIGQVRKFKVYVDNKLIGTVSNGQSQEFQISAGKHEIYCKQDIFNTPFKYEFTVSENETKTLKAQYKNKSFSSILMNIGVAILFFFSGIFSQFITEYFKINHLWWIPVYALFIILILWLMKAAKFFTIYISE